MAKKVSKREPITVGGVAVAAGTREVVRIPVAAWPNGGEAHVPVVVVHGARPGPRLFVSAAIHGDEVNGVEIIRRVLKMPAIAKLRGTLIAVPVVNVFGFLAHSRYLPDRRDLNRSFPGSPKGSLAGRLAHLFMQEVVSNCTHGLDLHTGAIHRSNLPQIRTTIDDEESLAMAKAFGVPVIVNADLRDGSLRQAAREHGIPALVYECGQALRFDELSLSAGVRGVVAVMRHLEMLRPSRRAKRTAPPTLARSTYWVRAPQGGVLTTGIPLGALVEAGATLGMVSDPVGAGEVAVTATGEGILIGRSELPVVNEGDALFHIASFKRNELVGERVEKFHAELEPSDHADEAAIDDMPPTD